MANSYSQRSLIVLSLQGVLSAIMSLLSVILIFQLESQQAAVTSPHKASLLPAGVWAVLQPVATVFSALSLTLNLSSVVVCLLHGYFSTEVCRGDKDTERADWFLLDSSVLRHVAIGLFCMGISVYLAAMSIFMLLIFEVETGVASACVLSSGILILLIVVIAVLVKASHTAKKFRKDHVGAVYQNDHSSTNAPLSRPCELKIGVDKPRMHRTQSYLVHNMAYPYCGNQTPIEHHQHLQHSPTEAAHDQESHKDGYSSGGSSSRMHRTLSSDSALLQAQVKPWNGVNNEMRSVLARKSGISAKDSTLV
uniref:Si:ch211-125m10.6 n=1 Tax=Neogobius melanostomus TaxID=47308 RepID=A0A8C6WLE8_9GOBI